MPRTTVSIGWAARNYKWFPVVRQDMARCPHCETDISTWTERLQQASAASTPKVWTCPECDVVLGISDWGHD
ncbi:hypothetical protein GCM10008985_16970 [Halococcus dombrowskii]|uniref:Small CPxCG-related zinc finger protein n=2 Tax=Halococcus dombrowskii TaxID=179637 RepID=A0AAV3SGV1_HALDO